MNSPLVRRCLYSLLLLLCCLADARARAQSWTISGTNFVVGQKYYGQGSYEGSPYIEYIPGDMPIVISAPHGGLLEPTDDIMPDRTYGEFVTDSNTEDVATDISAAMLARFGHTPHIIYCWLDRIKIDCNRDVTEGAQGWPATIQAWSDFQNFISVGTQIVNQAYPKGFYIDLHGQGHPIERLELGYLLTEDQLMHSNATLNSGNYASQTSIATLAQNTSLAFSDLLRGNSSLGGLFQALGYLATPSPLMPDPTYSLTGSALTSGTNPYFDGGYNTQLYGSYGGGTIDGVQIESNYTGVRDTGSNQAAFAAAIANVMGTWFTTYYGMDLSRGLPSISAISGTSTLGGAAASLAFTVSDPVDAASALTVTATSSDTSLVPLGNIVFSGTGSSRTMSVTPSNSSGLVTITVTVTNTNGSRSSSVFNLSISPFWISSVSPSGGNLVIKFSTLKNKLYRVQNCSNLTSGTWSTLFNNVSGTGGTVSVTHTGVLTSGTAQQYYRVLAL